jgi:hypothetical protein
MHSCGRRRSRAPARVRKEFDHGFQARSDVELRLAEYIGEVTEAGVFPANKAVVRETVGRHGEGIAMDAVGRRGRFGRMATNRLPALPTYKRNPTC